MTLLVALVATLGALAGCVPAKDRNKSQTHVELGKDLLGKGQDVEAENELKKAIAFDPENEEAHYVYGVLFIVRGAHFEDLVERENCLSGAEADGLRAEADEALHKADGELAKATQLAGDYGEAWLSRGVVALHFGDYDKAIEYCTKALENSGRLASAPLARANLGWALYHAKQPAKATVALRQAVQESPNLCLAKYRLAQVLFDGKDAEGAAAELAIFNPAPAQTPGSPDPKAVRCDAFLEALYLGGEVAEQIEGQGAGAPWFQRCIEAQPKSCMAKQCSQALKVP